MRFFGYPYNDLEDSPDYLTLPHFPLPINTLNVPSGSSSGLYSGGLTWSIVLRCDDYTDIFTCDGCARDPYFYVPAETQSYVIKLSCSRKVLAASGD